MIEGSWHPPDIELESEVKVALGGQTSRQSLLTWSTVGLEMIHKAEGSKVSASVC